LGIAAVVSAAKGYILKHDPSVLSWYLYLPADDHESFNIAKYFDESFNFIDKFIKETNVLVHCLAGVSRSVSLVIAYLMRKHDYSYKKAYCLVKSRRNKVPTLIT
jgi:protein-tyrosine phosphatase